MFWNACCSIKIFQEMKSLYLLLDLFTLLGPLALSFDKRVHYVSKWKTVFLSSFIIAIPFLVWDFYFTENGFWGFNPTYLTGYYIGNLPIEEVLFFFVVPFACTFIYECVVHYFRNINFIGLDKILKVTIPVYALVLALISDELGWYTFIVTITATIVLIWWIFQPKFQFIGISFLISLVPFLLVNGVLTGAVTESPIVWYSEAQKVSPRIITIPLEDVLYSFTLIVSVILLHEKLQKRLR